MSNMFPQVFTVTPEIDATALAAADRLDTAVTEVQNFFADKGKSATLLSLVVTDKAKQKIAFDIYLFNALPTVNSAANAPLDIADAEMDAKCIGRISVASGDYGTDLANSSEATKANIQMLLKGSETSKSLWLVLATRGTPTYGVTDALTFKFGVIRH
jgi:hypothetical protein